MKRMTKKLLTAFLPAVLLGGIVQAAEQAEEPTIVVTPSITYVHVNGDDNRFRHDWWIKDELSGGLEQLSIEKQLGNDWRLEVLGRALFDDDYALELALVKPEVGFVRAGYREFRKYYDDSGGYYPLFAAGYQFFSLGRDLHLDISDMYVQAGLTLPNWPVIVVGYNRQEKEGTKSILEWGSVSTRKIYPTAKDVDESVDIVTVSLEHTIENVELADQFRYERYKVDTFREVSGSFSPPALAPTTVSRIWESFESDLYQNAFQMGSQVNELTYWSAGYLFSHMGGTPFIDVDTDPIGAPSSNNRNKDWQTVSSKMDQDSHVLNVNAMFGPFFKKSTYLTAGIQAEKTETDARAFNEIFEPALLLNGATVNDLTADVTTRNDKTWFTEELGLRFVGIPFTTLYAEAKWQQGSVNLFEEELEQGPDGLLAEYGTAPDGTPWTSALISRYTDTDVTRENYRIGFNTAPITRLTVGGYYQRKDRDNRYNNLIDMEVLSTNNVPDAGEAKHDGGYSAFIDRQQIVTDEFGAKIGLRLNQRTSLSFKYQRIETEIDTQFEPAGTSGQTGDYEANVYSVSASMVPINRMYLSALFSYQDTTTKGRDNGSAVVADYTGDVYSVVASSAYLIDAKTEVRLTYSFSYADNAQGNNAVGLDYGADYARHGAQIQLARQLRENIQAEIGYGFYHLDDDTSGGYDNYTAHLISGSCTLRF